MLKNRQVEGYTLFTVLRSFVVGFLWVVGVCAFLAIAEARAQTVASRVLEVSWETPTGREDGTELALSEIAGYQIRLYHAGDEVALFAIDNPASKVFTFDFDQYLTQYGYQDFAMTIATIDSLGQSSRESEPVLILANSVNPPGAINVRIIYEYRTTNP